MLAQSFLKPEALGISEEEQRALVKVLGMLERGELKYTHREEPIANGFNMSCVSERNECGTVACIVGWAGIIMSKDFEGPKHGAKGAKALGRLICPANWGDGAYTVPQAAIALRSYLTTGEPRWEEALS